MNDERECFQVASLVQFIAGVVEATDKFGGVFIGECQQCESPVFNITGKAVKCVCCGRLIPVRYLNRHGQLGSLVPVTAHMRCQ